MQQSPVHPIANSVHPIKQKCILYIDPYQGTYSGAAIFQVPPQRDRQTLSISASALYVHSTHTYHSENHAWAEAAEAEKGILPSGAYSVGLPPHTERVKVLFNGTASGAISFYRENAVYEFVGGALNGVDASFLFPVVPGSRHPMEMLYIVPTLIDAPGARTPPRVLSTGHLIGVYDGGSTKSFHFQAPQGCAPESVLFVGGAFEEIHSGRVAVGFPACLAQTHAEGVKEALEILKATLAQAHSLLHKGEGFACGSPPTGGSTTLVFSMCEIEPLSGPGLMLLNASQVPIPSAIDQCFSSCRVLPRAVAEQLLWLPVRPFLGHLDAWLYMGLTGYLSSRLVEHFLGANEVRHRLSTHAEWLHRRDIEEPPLSSPLRAPGSFSSPFFQRKSQAVVQVLEHLLRRPFMERLLKEIYSVTGAGGPSPPTPITTAQLAALAKSVTGREIGYFLEAYVARAGVPRVKAVLEHNPRADTLTVLLTQSNPSQHKDAGPGLSGSITLRVADPEGVLDHSLPISGPATRHELPLIRTSRRSRRGDPIPGVPPPSANASTSLAPGVAASSAASPTNTTAATILWARLDPCVEWLKVAQVEQPDYKHAEQLATERDVYGQMEALWGVERAPTEAVSGVLERVLESPSVFYKVAISAGLLLARSLNQESGYFGFQRVVQYFITQYCIQNTTIVRSNEFSSFRAYFMQKCVAASMALSRLDATRVVAGKSVRAKSVVSAFLLNLIRCNDNTGNPYEDAFYLADIISALSVSLCADGPLDAVPFLREIERIRRRDLLLGSPQNVLTCACIKALTRVALTGEVKVSANILRTYTNPRNFYKVRMAAYEGLILLFPERVPGEVLPRLHEECLLVRERAVTAVLGVLQCGALRGHSVLTATPGARRDLCAALNKISAERPSPGLRQAVRSCVALLSEATEVVAPEEDPEDCLRHDLSSDTEHPQGGAFLAADGGGIPRKKASRGSSAGISVRVIRPLTVVAVISRSYASSGNAINGNASNDNASASNGNAINGNSEQVTQLEHLGEDVHAREYLLDAPPEEALRGFIQKIQSSKSYAGAAPYLEKLLKWANAEEASTPPGEAACLEGNLCLGKVSLLHRRLEEEEFNGCPALFKAYAQREFLGYARERPRTYTRANARGKRALAALLREIEAETDSPQVKNSLRQISEALNQGAYALSECLIEEVSRALSTSPSTPAKTTLEKVCALSLDLFTQPVTLSQILFEVADRACVPESALFHQRVSAAEYPQYYAVVSQPMSLYDLRDRARSGYYKNITHFEADAQRIYRASTQYNGASSEITRAAKKVTNGIFNEILLLFPWHKSLFHRRTHPSRR